MNSFNQQQPTTTNESLNLLPSLTLSYSLSLALSPPLIFYIWFLFTKFVSIPGTHSVVKRKKARLKTNMTFSLFSVWKMEFHNPKHNFWSNRGDQNWFPPPETHSVVIRKKSKLKFKYSYVPCFLFTEWISTTGNQFLVKSWWQNGLPPPETHSVVIRCVIYLLELWFNMGYICQIRYQYTHCRCKRGALKQQEQQEQHE